MKIKVTVDARSAGVRTIHLRRRLFRVVITARTGDDGQSTLPGTLKHTVKRIRDAGGEATYLTCDLSKASDRELRARADRVLKLCRLDKVAMRAAATLSYGEEKMLGVAMAMMCEPRLLLLDEPASGLGQQEIINLGLVLRDLHEHGITLCIIDHKVAFLAEFANRLMVLQNGNKIAEGAPGEVLSNPNVITAYLGRQHVGA